ncbi:hypothetical protein FHT15_003205 [Xanthomonas campestris]
MPSLANPHWRGRLTRAGKKRRERAVRQAQMVVHLTVTYPQRAQHQTAAALTHW